jgi:hypothetical protein
VNRNPSKSTAEEKEENVPIIRIKQDSHRRDLEYYSLILSLSVIFEEEAIKNQPKWIPRGINNNTRDLKRTFSLSRGWNFLFDPTNTKGYVKVNWSDVELLTQSDLQTTDFIPTSFYSEELILAYSQHGTIKHLKMPRRNKSDYVPWVHVQCSSDGEMLYQSKIGGLTNLLNGLEFPIAMEQMWDLKTPNDVADYCRFLFPLLLDKQIGLLWMFAMNVLLVKTARNEIKFE